MIQPILASDRHRDRRAAAAKASPELVGELSKQMAATPEQSAGAAGALFGVAKSCLNADQFSQVAPVLVGFVTKSGGANVGNLLASALK